MHETRAQSYWNHNTAYFPWVKAQISQGSRVLDVGCGDGTLAAFLCGHAAQVDALDPFPRCIELAQETYGHLPTLHFAESPFETFAAEAETYDAVTFVASLHHMEQKQAVEKAKTLLKSDGKLLVVGLASPSSFVDRLRELGRVFPALVGTKWHRIRSTEELGVPTSYALPTLSDIRTLVTETLPGATLKHGLYYRYLLSWQKP